LLHDSRTGDFTVFLVFALLFVILAIYELARGGFIDSSWRWNTREDQPVWFWVVIAVRLLCVGFFAWAHFHWDGT